MLYFSFFFFSVWT